MGSEKFMDFGLLGPCLALGLLFKNPIHLWTLGIKCLSASEIAKNLMLWK